MALSSPGPTTRDRSLAELIRDSSAFILDIISAIMRFDPAAPPLADKLVERGADETLTAPPMRAAARTEARSWARAEGDEVRP